MSKKHLKYAAGLLIGAASLPAAAEPADTGVALTAPADSVKLEPRTYMGQTVMVPDSENQLDNAVKESWWSKVRATGSIQTEFMVPFDDAAINTPKYEKRLLNNTYFDLTVNAPYVSVGARFQWTKYPLPGYEPEFAGWGVPYFWATGRYKWFQLTAGDFYEQFGSGLILRTYQDRALGVDGALRGGRLKLNPVNGLYITALAGKERYYWTHNPAWIWGADAEWSLDETFAKAFGSNYGLTLGFSYVGKHEGQQLIVVKPEETSRLWLPENVAAFDGRAKVRLLDFNILAEFAYKNNDPDYVNNYIYRPGHAELLSLSYTKNGFSGFIQAKRSENMSYMSDRLITGQDGNGYINHLPAFTNTQTYTLAALYPYATDWNGEWAFQAQLAYLFKRGTALGGKYGTSVRLSASYISDLYDSAPLGYPKSAAMGSNGYGAPFWKIGGLRYSDLNFEINKKFSRKLQFTLFYLFQKLNINKVMGHAENGDMVTANIFVLEGQWKIAKRTQLRWELQYLTTRQDEGDWMAGLIELSLAPHWMFTLTDTYNVGVTNLNYYSAMVTYNYRANRFSLSFGRNRAGFNCAGGVCRWVPATKGFSLTYNYTF